jgi:hypothetical protein
MKTKIILAAIICLLGFQTTYADIKKSTENWTRETGTQEMQRSGAIGDQTPSDDPVIPIGDAFWLTGLLAGGYVLIKRRTLRRTVRP